MARPRFALRLAGALPALALFACAHKVPPVTSLDGRVCVEHPELLGSRPLEIEKPATVEVDGQTPCLEPPGAAPAAYLVFKLPETAEPGILTVSSRRVGETLFAPRLMLLDGDGNVTREQPLRSFMFRGSALADKVRLHPGERYLVVASDPAAVGKQESRIVSSTNTSAAVAGPVIFTMTTGNEAHDAFTYAHNGSVTVAVRPLPKAE